MKINKYFVITFAVIALTSCVDLEQLDFPVTKPESIAQLDYLKDYDVLKSYIDRTTMPNFKLGAGVSVSDFNAKGIGYRLISSNFDEMSAGWEMKHGAVVQNDGSLNLTTVEEFLQTAESAGVSVFGHTLVWHANQNATYLNSLIAPTVIPGEVEPKWEVLTEQDFETDAASNYSKGGAGTTAFTAAGGGSDGVGRAFTITNGAVLANDWECQFFVTFPRAVSEGEKIRLSMDIKSDVPASYSTQAQTAPGAYKHWDFFGTLSSTTQWTTYTREITVSGDQATSNTIAFNLGTTATTYYFDNVLVEFYNEKPMSSGSDVIADFESDAPGKTYAMSGNGSAVVVADPKGSSGNVLNINGPANYSYPMFEVTLPAGRKLGDYTSVTIDFNGTGSTGLYGSGMRLAINDVNAAAVYGGPSTFGCPEGDWGRAKIVLPLSNLNLTNDQKQLKTFTLIVGSGTGSGNYYIDNITMQWEGSTDIIIEKTPEEMKQILTDALETWISGIMGVSKYVKAWDIVNEPMSDWPDPTKLKTGIGKTDMSSDEFYWQDYLGEDYAVTAIQLARKYGNSDDKLFINDYGLESSIEKCQGLIEYVKYVESKGVKVDGIGTQMHISTNTDRSKIDAMFTALAATGKLIKISELDMGIAGDVKTADATQEQLMQQSDLYEYVVKKYMELIPAAQRYGITHWSPTDSPASSSWRADQPIGLWSLNYSRKHAYAGFAKGLGAK